MENRIFEQIARETGIPLSGVKSTAGLLDDGNTVPFIARYRKEVTGELDEVKIREIEERLTALRNLEQRKEEVMRLIEEQGKLTDELKGQIAASEKISRLEDLYRPYRPKRKTRAGVARERGLAPLADCLLSLPAAGDVTTMAAEYVNGERGVDTPRDALQGAMDIIAERVSDDPDARGWVRKFTFDRGMLVTEAMDREQKSVYEMYYDHSEQVRQAAPHRVLAINRGEREGFLRVRVDADEEFILNRLNGRWAPKPSATTELVQEAVRDGYRRLMAPAVERDVRNQLTLEAGEQAIHIFSRNLRQLLLQPPVKGKVILGVDPAYRTGCKWAVIEETGKMHEVGVVYPTPPQKKVDEARAVFKRIVDRYNVEIIAIGNGTASRETEQFVASFIGYYKDNVDSQKTLHYVMVSEAGASVYSASELAAREFPGLDAAQRSAVSIARRFQDPLAELVKIDPKSVGVGQYQHDVAAKRLEESLGKVVESVVNYVGVDLNTASPSLLTHVSGINSSLARNIVLFREEAGKFKNRSQLKKVPRLGPKAFEQCVGFLRIPDGDVILDRTPIHPESYDLARQLLQEINCTLQDVGAPTLKQRLASIKVEDMAEKIGAGVPTLRDIVDSLLKPGRDPRDEMPPPVLRSDILKIEDLKAGMELKGTVRNVVDFGAFVDIGVKADGLVHRSEISDRYIKHPMDALSVGDVVNVRVLSVDVERQRISLTMKG